MPANSLALTLDRSDHWRDDAGCRDADVDVFFALDEASQQAAVAICATCPVRVECLEHALATGEQYGVWGGVREQERKRIARSRRRRAA